MLLMLLVMWDRREGQEPVKKLPEMHLLRNCW
jgi:hypothetical protein